MTDEENGRIFVISAPSGSGKTTLTNALIKRGRCLVRSVSMTTRSRRKGERNKKDYYFVTEKEFKKHISRGGFLEWAKNFRNFYGTPRRFVEDSIKKGKDVILAIDVKGAMQIRKAVPAAVLIFVVPPSRRELRRRLRKRNTEHKTSISTRLKVAGKEMTYIPKYDYVVVNDSIEKAVGKLRTIIAAERCKT